MHRHFYHNNPMSPSTSPLRIVQVALVWLLLLGGELAAQIEVSPTRVLLTTRSRAQEINIYNSSDDQVEITTELGFKLIQSDSAGRISLRDAERPEETERSCKDWIKLFPRRFMLAPHTSRSVRVLIVPPDGVGDGEFWARVVFGSAPVAPALAGNSDTSGIIRSSLQMRLSLDIPIIFRRGTVETGIALEGFSVRRTEKGLLALADLRRLGNAAYRGTLRLQVRTPDGEEVASAEEQFTSEFTVRRGLRLPLLPPGSYRVEATLVSTKKGGANDAVLPAPTVQQQYDLLVSPTDINVTARE